MRHQIWYKLSAGRVDANGWPQSRGDTILSVLISVVIIGSVIGTTYYVVNSSLRLGRAGQERGHALNVVHNQIERIKAVLDTDPDRIFMDSESHGLIGSPPWTWGSEFCLWHDPSAMPAPPGAPPSILIRLANGTDCSGIRSEFPVLIANPKVTIQYQHEESTHIPGDNNRFRIKIVWIGADGRDEELVAYFRSHPIAII